LDGDLTMGPGRLAEAFLLELLVGMLAMLFLG
jgi:hypothetical protein